MSPVRPLMVAVVLALGATGCSEGSQEPPADATPSATTATPLFDGVAVPTTVTVPTQRLAVWFLAADGQLSRHGRLVAGTDVARAVALHLFAGPTPDEAAAGVRLESSGFTGVGSVRRNGGLVEVRLVGDCDPPEQGRTIADLVILSESEIPGVNVVRVLDAEGRSQQLGPGPHAVPPCLLPAGDDASPQ